MRDLLLARVQPAIEQLAAQLVDLLLERIEQHMNQLELAFDAASSAFASDLSVTDGAARQHDVPGEGERSGRLEGDRETRRRVSRAKQGKDLPPSTSSTSDRACGCGPLGRHRKTCALRSTSPASEHSDPALTDRKRVV